MTQDFTPEDVVRVAEGLSDMERWELFHHTRAHYRTCRFKWLAAGAELKRQGLIQVHPNRNAVRLTLFGEAASHLLTTGDKS